MYGPRNRKESSTSEFRGRIIDKLLIFIESVGTIVPEVRNKKHDENLSCDSIVYVLFVPKLIYVWTTHEQNTTKKGMSGSLERVPEGAEG